MQSGRFWKEMFLVKTKSRQYAKVMEGRNYDGYSHGRNVISLLWNHQTVRGFLRKNSRTQKQEKVERRKRL